MKCSKTITRKVAWPTVASVCVFLGGVAPHAYAEFFEDAKGKVMLRNFYYNRDYREQSSSQAKREDWAQGITLLWESGYTEGKVGFGLDLMGMVGLKLDDGARGEGGGGLMPRDKNGSSRDHYGKSAATAKVKYANSELRYGALSPRLPLLHSNSSRLFPQIYNGTQVVSKDIKGLTVTAGRLDKVKQRDSTDFEGLTIMGQAGAYDATVTSDEFLYAGLDYEVNRNLTLSYHWSQLEDIFRRDFFGLKFSVPAGPGKVFGDIRYFIAREAGEERVGNVDNNTISTNFGYQWKGHTVYGGYQEVSGETAFAFVGGADTYLFGEQMVSQFSFADERLWHVGYDFDFVDVGIPGLKFTFRYVSADHVDPTHMSGSEARELRAHGARGNEWERYNEIAYVVQSGPFKNLGMRWRNSTNRSNFASGADENRVMVDYVFNF